MCNGVKLSITPRYLESGKGDPWTRDEREGLGGGD